VCVVFLKVKKWNNFNTPHFRSNSLDWNLTQQYMELFESLFREIMKEIGKSNIKKIPLEDAIKFYNQQKDFRRPKEFEFLTLLLVQGKNNVSEVNIEIQSNLVITNFPGP